MLAFFCWRNIPGELTSQDVVSTIYHLPSECVCVEFVLLEFIVNEDFCIFVTAISLLVFAHTITVCIAFNAASNSVVMFCIIL